MPYVIGVAGSVAVGKSTFARILQALLARWPDHPQVELVTTDGFLYPNKVLDERGIMNRKGFPESYDTRRLLQFLREVKSGAPRSHAPVYSHVVYDIVPGETVTVSQPDILILEGLNVLQVGALETASEFVSDYFDFSIYIDADGGATSRSGTCSGSCGCARRCSRTRTGSSATSPRSHEQQAVEVARGIWHEINGKNLRENIEPTKSRASLLLRKGRDHRVTDVALRRL